jgi:4-hydroxy-tetrahydrodipicolinate synthase
VLAGGVGVISVIGQALPKQFCNMIQLGLQGKAKEAYTIHYQLMDITGYIFEENNPAGIKAVFEALGMCRDSVRLPLVPASKALKSEIKAALESIDSY